MGTQIPPAGAGYPEKGGNKYPSNQSALVCTLVNQDGMKKLVILMLALFYLVACSVQTTQVQDKEVLPETVIKERISEIKLPDPGE